MRVGYIDGELVLNPTFTQMDQSSLELVLASTADAVVMVESGAKEVPEELMFQALHFGHEANQEIIAMQRELVAEIVRRVPGYIRRSELPPGLTGLAQVNGRYGTDAEFKLGYDIQYLVNW